MALKHFRSVLTVSFTCILLVVLFPTETVQARSESQRARALPLLDTFVRQVQNGAAGDLRGIYIPDVLAARIVQQPKGEAEFVSPRQNVVTQFNLASQFRSIGLLAHNDQAGEAFFQLETDQRFHLIYGDGSISSFVITERQGYQALQPDSPSSRFLSLDNGDYLTSSELFTRVYARPGTVIFQTCISTDDHLTWGRLFIIAEPELPAS
jgi:hypothetical protein